MKAPATADQIRAVASLLEGWGLPVDFEMPSIEELENDLALGNPGWTGLLRPDRVIADLTARKGEQFSARWLFGVVAAIATTTIGAASIAAVSAGNGSPPNTLSRPHVETYNAERLSSSHIIWTARGPIYIGDLMGGGCVRPRGHHAC